MITQKVLPAIKNMKEFEKILKTDFEYIVILNSHVAQIKNIVDTAHKHQKKILVHIDMIAGLKNDVSGTVFVCQEIKPDGIISTKKQAIITAKKRGLLAIQRLFLIDSNALNNGLELLEMTEPDYIELLPGIVPTMIEEIKSITNTPIIAGGLIRKQEEIDSAIEAGAISVSTSIRDLWK